MNSLLFLPEVNAYKLRPPYLLNGGRYKSRVWSESDKIWCGQLRICLGKSCREVRLVEPDSGEVFAHTLIPLHGVEYSVLDSHEQFVMEFTDGGIQTMYLGLEFRESSDACRFYRALICAEEEEEEEREGDGDGEEEGESESARAGSEDCYEVHIDIDDSGMAGKTGNDMEVDQLTEEATKILKEHFDKINEVSRRKDLKVQELEAENLRVKCKLTELHQVNARHIEWLKEKDEQLKELEAKQEDIELEKLDLQQQISTLNEESAAKSNQISTLNEESAAKSNQISTLNEESAAKSNQISMLMQESAVKSDKMKELEKKIIQVLTGIQKKEEELHTEIFDNLRE